MRFILHVGAPKCGSSAIQDGLFRKRAALLSQKVLYNPIGAQTGHYLYATLLGQNIRLNGNTMLDRARNNVAQTREMIAKHRPEIVLISGENLLAADPEQVIGLCCQIGGTAQVCVDAVGFVRHPVPLYLSSVQQQLKGSHLFTLPDQQRDRMSARVAAWQAHPACQSVTIRLFDRARMRGGSVLSEFANLLSGLTGGSELDLSGTEVNVSHSAEQMAVMQAFRRRHFAECPDVLQAPSGHLSQFFHHLNTTVGRVGTQPQLKPGVAALVLKDNQAAIAALDRLLPDLGMASSLSVPDAAAPNAEEISVQDVRTILRDFDPDIYRKLADIVPQDNPGLIEDLAGLGARLDAFGPGARRDYTNYLERIGYGDWAHRVLALQT